MCVTCRLCFFSVVVLYVHNTHLNTQEIFSQESKLLEIHCFEQRASNRVPEQVSERSLHGFDEAPLVTRGQINRTGKDAGE